MGRQSACRRVSYEQQHINKYGRGRLAADLALAGYATIDIGTAVGLAPFAAGLASVRRVGSMPSSAASAISAAATS